MTPDLEQWLQRATRHLSKESAAQVCVEIQEHYESAREAAIECGASPDDASRAALAALGDARIANKEYRGVLLTASEARMVRESGPWATAWPIGWAVSAISLLAVGYVFDGDWFAPSRISLALALGIGFTILTSRLPVYTVARARVFRVVRCFIELGLWALAFGRGAPWMLFVLVLMIFQLVWTELKRASIRRKLPVADWPRQLYL